MDKQEQEVEAITGDPAENNGGIASEGSKGEDLQKGGGDVEIERRGGGGSVVEGRNLGANKVDDVSQEVLSNGKPEEESIQENNYKPQIEAPEVVEQPEEKAEELVEQPKVVDNSGAGDEKVKLADENDEQGNNNQESSKGNTDESYPEKSGQKKVGELVEEPKEVGDELVGKLENDKADAPPVGEKLKEKVEAVDEREAPVLVEEKYKGGSSGVETKVEKLSRDDIAKSVEQDSGDDPGIKQETPQAEDEASNKNSGVADGPVESCDAAASARGWFKQLVSWCIGDHQKFDSHSWASGLALGVVITCSAVVLSKHLERRV